jgi:hypothetical protein
MEGKGERIYLTVDTFGSTYGKYFGYMFSHFRNIACSSSGLSKFNEERVLKL